MVSASGTTGAVVCGSFRSAGVPASASSNGNGAWGRPATCGDDGSARGPGSGASDTPNTTRQAPKTSRRTSRLNSELRPHLESAFEQAPEGAEYVITLHRMRA